MDSRCPGRGRALGRRRRLTARRRAALALALVVVAGTTGCSRGSAEERAAAKAIDACIAALAPVADDRPPPADVLGDARADAEEAARTDERWVALAAALRRAEEAAGAAGGDAAVAALVEECRRSRDHVRRSGREPRQA